jgi:hypothetical protein
MVLNQAVTSSSAKSTVLRLFGLELNAGCIHSMNTAGNWRTGRTVRQCLPLAIAVAVSLREAGVGGFRAASRTTSIGASTFTVSTWARSATGLPVQAR